MNMPGEDLPGDAFGNPHVDPGHETVALRPPVDTEALFEAARLAIDTTKRLRAIQRIQPFLSKHLAEQSMEYFKKSVDSMALFKAVGLMLDEGIEVGVSRTEPRQELYITEDPDHNIALNHGKPMSLSRRLQRKKEKERTTYDEDEGNAFRAAALKVFAENPEKAFRRIDILRALHPDDPDYEYGRNLWETHIEPFLHNPPVYGGEPLIQAIRAGRQDYRFVLGNFDVTWSKTDRVLNVEDAPQFTFENGRTVAGKAGGVLRMLAAATPDNPVTNEDVIALYTEQELAELKFPIRKLLQLTVSGINSNYLKGQDTELMTWRVKLDVKDPETGYRQAGYYMEPRLSKLEARQVASLLEAHEDVLAGNGADAPHEALLKALREDAGQQSSSERMSALEVSRSRARGFDKINRLLAERRQLKRFVDQITAEDPNDPRLALLTYMEALLEDAPMKSKVEGMLHGEYQGGGHMFTFNKNGTDFIDQKPE